MKSALLCPLGGQSLCQFKQQRWFLNKLQQLDKANHTLLTKSKYLQHINTAPRARRTLSCGTLFMTSLTTSSVARTMCRINYLVYKYGRKLSRSNWIYYLGVFLKGLRETMKNHSKDNRSPGEGLKLVASDCWEGILTGRHHGVSNIVGLHNVKNSSGLWCMAGVSMTFHPSS